LTASNGLCNDSKQSWNAYRTLAEIEAKAENCKKAIEAYEGAIKVFTKEDFPDIYQLVEKNLQKLFNYWKGK